MNWTAEITWANKYFASFSTIFPPVVILLNNSPPLAYSITRCILLYVSTTSYNLWKKKKVRIPFFLDMTLSLSKEILTFWGSMGSSTSRTAMFLDILPVEVGDATLPLNVTMHLPVMQHNIPEGLNAQLHAVKTSELTKGTLLIFLLITQDMSLSGSVFRGEMYNVSG